VQLKYVTNTIKDSITYLGKGRDGHHATSNAATADFLQYLHLHSSSCVMIEYGKELAFSIPLGYSLWDGINPKGRTT
jgi:hypothetical protein